MSSYVVLPSNICINTPAKSIVKIRRILKANNSY